MIDVRSWNAALDAAAILLGRDGYTYIRRPLDAKTMTCPIEIKRGDARVRGDYTDATHCTPDPEGKDMAAILSLKRKEK
jgi:hypothetical protein